MEIWKDIKGYEGLYQVSNQGKVKSLSREMFNGSGYFNSKEILLKQSNKKGYKMVALSYDAKIKTFRVHRLVYQTFKGELPSDYNIVVDHIDNNKTNNYSDNLQLLTQRDNIIKSKKLLDSTSKYVGVSWDRNRLKWLACIEIGGKTKHLGLFNEELEASKQYNLKYIELNNNINKTPGMGVKSVSRCILLHRLLVRILLTTNIR